VSENARVHVTEAIRLAGLMGDTSHFTDYSRDRGTAVHLLTQLDDEGDLDESSVDPALAPYLVGWRKFKAEYRPAWTGIELPVEHPIYPFCGRLDRVGTINGGRHAVVDVKSGGSNPSHPVQLAAYQSCLPKANYLRIVVRLNGEGGYASDLFGAETYIADLSVFLSAVNLWSWKKKEGLL
jgi:hypothetical protein